MSQLQNKNVRIIFIIIIVHSFISSISTCFSCERVCIEIYNKWKFQDMELAKFHKNYSVY